jgi:hypothetical protein
MKIDAFREAFGSRVFSAKEASVAFGPTVRSDLSRLVLDGRLERAGRGLYRLADSTRRAAIRRTRSNLLRDEALRAPLAIALDGPDAVSAWTGGRYTVGPPGVDPVLYLAVDAKDAVKARAWLTRIGWRVGSAKSWPEGPGPKAIVRTVADLKRTMLDGMPVITKPAVLRLMRAPAYEGAKEWLLER